MTSPSSPALLRARVSGVSQESPRVVGLRLSVPAGYDWSPGQHLALSAAAAGAPLGYYSIASAPLDAPSSHLELAALGDSLPEGVVLEAGAEVWISPAGGQLTLERLLSAPSIVLIGMGTGVAPLRAMVQGLAGSGKLARTTLLQGAREELDLLFAEEFRELEKEGLGYRPVLSRPDSKWQGRAGRVQQHLDGLDKEANFRLCGSAAMVQELRARLSDLGVAEERIDGEGY